MSNYDDGEIPPTRVYMHPDDYRAIVVWALMEEGYSESDALCEAEKRLSQIQPLPNEPDPMILEMVHQMTSGEG